MLQFKGEQVTGLVIPIAEECSRTERVTEKEEATYLMHILCSH